MKKIAWLKKIKLLCIKDILKIVVKYLVMIVIVAYACVGIMMENVFYIAYDTTFTTCFCIAIFLILMLALIKNICMNINKFYKNWRVKRCLK